MTNRSIVLLVVLASLLEFSATCNAEYLWPLPFGKELTSVYGDYRTRRYHVGIDIRTGGEIGKTVIAPEDGYIMRIRTGYRGYGKAIYFRMSDGNIAVFAHLSAFSREVEEYIQRRQIEKEDYHLDLEFDSQRFPFKRGETIAYSGATGVGAPHLHFEIRTPDNVPRNPLRFPGISVYDNISPIFKSVRIIGIGNNELASALGWKLGYPLQKAQKGGEYTLSAPLPCGLDDYWIAVEAVDKIGRSSWDKPLYEIEARSLDTEIYSLRLDDIPFESTDLICAERNFPLAIHGSQEYYNLVTPEAVSQGIGLCEQIGESYLPVELVARDVAGNSSRAIIKFFDISKAEHNGKLPVPVPDTSKLNNLILKHGSEYGQTSAAWFPARDKLFLLIKLASSQSARVTAVAFKGEGRVQLEQIAAKYYLGVVDQAKSGEDSPRMLDYDSLQVLVEPGVGESYALIIPIPYSRLKDYQGGLNFIESADTKFSVHFSSTGDLMFPLEQSSYFRIEQSESGGESIYKILPSEIPLLQQVEYRHSLESGIPKGIGMYSVDESGLYFMGGVIDSVAKSISCRSTVLAGITTRQDTVPPIIQQLRPKSKSLLTSSRPAVSFRLTDELSGIDDDIDILIDGKWCIPIFDPESDLVSSDPHFDLAPGTHKLEIRVRDKVGNVRTSVAEFTRTSK